MVVEAKKREIENSTCMMIVVIIILVDINWMQNHNIDRHVFRSNRLNKRLLIVKNTCFIRMISGNHQTSFMWTDITIPDGQ
jgi:hypothetical protein